MNRSGIPHHPTRWSYNLTRQLTTDKDQLLLGMFMGLRLDMDDLPLPGVPHRGIIHTPVTVFASLVFGLILSHGSKLAIQVFAVGLLHI